MGQLLCEMGRKSTRRLPTATHFDHPAPVIVSNHDPLVVGPESRGGCCSWRATAGHAVWAAGHVHQTGFTTAWTPNRNVLGGPAKDLDLDLNGRREKLGGPTFAA